MEASVAASEAWIRHQTAAALQCMQPGWRAMVVVEQRGSYASAAPAQSVGTPSTGDRAAGCPDGGATVDQVSAGRPFGKPQTECGAGLAPPFVEQRDLPAVRRAAPPARRLPIGRPVTNSAKTSGGVRRNRRRRSQPGPRARPAPSDPCTSGYQAADLFGPHAPGLSRPAAL